MKSRIFRAALVCLLVAGSLAACEVQTYDDAVAGIGGAPIFGDPAAWAPRIAKGIETLNDHAVNGFTDVGYMPPKGGRIDLSDAEILDAVAYMVAEVR